jgi:Zn-dependent membrane protease YugP
MKPTIKSFARFVLEKEGLTDWKVVDCADAVSFCNKKRKEIQLSENATYGLVLHEIAHALDGITHPDLMHQLFDKYGAIPNYQTCVEVE